MIIIVGVMTPLALVLNVGIGCKLSAAEFSFNVNVIH